MPKHKQTYFEDSAAIEKTRTKSKKPSLYRVFLNNDDYTPMGFVVHILQTFFNMDLETATQIMLQVHTQGRANCGIFPYDIAATKVSQINNYAKKHEHPLLCDKEKA